jgi:hypothetical protein
MCTDTRLSAVVDIARSFAKMPAWNSVSGQHMVEKTQSKIRRDLWRIRLCIELLSLSQFKVGGRDKKRK